ncbi:MAG: pitrilysin family protein [Candidatus Binatia bacterium]|nr:pitrilysin family protein [Candidatus Binatia bacterium]
MGNPQQSSVRKSTLSNGIRVLTEPIPQFSSATIGIWVENGSRFESPAQNGVSHFLEHMLFKGTERRNAREVAEEIESLGGSLNAFTGREVTCYHAKVLDEHLPIAVDVLSDIFLNSTFLEEEIERERTVILAEISEVEDAPDQYVQVLFDEKYWPGDPLSRPICGTAETVSGMGRDDFVAFVAERYRPDRIVIAAAGGVEHDWLVEQIETRFGHLQGTVDRAPVAMPTPSLQLGVHQKSLEQVQMMLGMPGLSAVDEERYAAFVLNTALGDGMSSRLFQEVREKRGKAYSIYSYLDSFSNAGSFGVYAALGAESVPEVIDVVREELSKLEREGLPADELERSKNQIKGGMLLSLESTAARMRRLAVNEIYFGRNVEPHELATSITAVTGDDVLAMASRLFSDGRMAAALLGNLEDTSMDGAALGLS